jgi:hypothetical protein
LLGSLAASIDSGSESLGRMLLESMPRSRYETVVTQKPP